MVRDNRTRDLWGEGWEGGTLGQWRSREGMGTLVAGVVLGE